MSIYVGICLGFNSTRKTPYFIVLLFQPDDHGLIGDVQVLRVTRQGPEAVHFVSSPLEVGEEVLVKVDWERRFDHMQQHSGKDQRPLNMFVICHNCK